MNRPRVALQSIFTLGGKPPRAWTRSDSDYETPLRIGMQMLLHDLGIITDAVPDASPHEQDPVDDRRQAPRTHILR